MSEMSSVCWWIWRLMMESLLSLKPWPSKCHPAAIRPGTLGYEWFLSADLKRSRLVETYVDAAAVLEHFSGPVVQQLVPKLMQIASVTRFEVYGDPGERWSPG